jgi:hypothetical protein
MSTPKYLQKEESTKEKSIKNEKRVQRQLASGATKFHPGDFSLEDCLIELKEPTKGKSIKVTKEMMQKIFNEGWIVEGKKPILMLKIEEYTLIGEVIKTKEIR